MSRANGFDINTISWKRMKLKDVTSKVTDGTHHTPKYTTSGVHFVSVKDVYDNKIDFSNTKFISEEDHNELIKRCHPEEGDILITKSGTIGRLAIVPQKKFSLFVSVALLKLKRDLLDSKYAFYALQNHVNHLDIKSQIKGGLLKNYHLEDLRLAEIPVPEIEEQQQIVSKIEELFSELDKSIEQLKTAQQQLKVYRQSVLNSILVDSDLKPIESIIEKLDQGWSPKCENYPSKNDKWGVIKTSAIQHGYFLEHENKELPKELKPREQHELKAGDILITRAGPRIRVGVCCLVKNVRPKLLNCDKVYRIRVNERIIRPEYLEFILNTPKYLDEIEKMKTGISDSGVNLTQKGFLQINIPIPSLVQQRRLIEEAQEHTSVADKLKETITNSLQQAEAIRQSILKKAFEGKLLQ